MHLSARLPIACILICAGFAIAAGPQLEPTLNSKPLTPVSAQGTRSIEWRSGRAEHVVMNAAQLRSAVNNLTERGTPRHAVVQLKAPLQKGQRDALRAAGFALLDHLGNHGWFVRISPADLDLEQATRRVQIEHVSAVDAAWKVHPSLQAGHIPAWAELPLGRRGTAAASAVALNVKFFKGVSLRDARPVIERLGGTVRSEIDSVNGLSVTLPLQAIAALAAEDVVQWIEPPLPALTELNDEARELTGADAVQAAPYGLDGDGVQVLVFDAGQAQVNHPDLQGRGTVGPSDNEGTSTHSTHVACTVAGSGSVECGAFRGMAPAARVLSYGFSPAGSGTFLYTDPGDIEVDYTEAIGLGATISNNSIGTNLCNNGWNNPTVFDCDFTGDYGVTAELLDSIVLGSLGRDMRVVWSGGNERSCSRCTNNGGANSQGFHSTAPPSCAKNPIVVGAINSDNESMTGFSSYGPCDDGRIRPDVVGPGCQSSGDFGIRSCSANGGYVSICGTSMSAPVVTGIGALLLQEYRSRNPSADELRNASLKAVLTHTAKDWGLPGPDYRSGYGSVRAVPAVELLREDSLAESSLSQAEVHTFFVQVRPGDTLFKTTLAWDDAPGVPNIEPSLVNDLDLRVFSPAGVLQFPWTLNPNNPANAAIQSEPDHINNIEQVAVQNPQPGSWRIEVLGFDVPTGAQAYSLVATPQLPVCNSKGAVAFSADSVGCEASVDVQVLDCDLNGDDLTAEEIVVNVVSDSDVAGEMVVLTETGVSSGVFRGSVPVSASDIADTLLVAGGDNISVIYIDADDGAGEVDVERLALAGVDCTAPQLQSLNVLSVNNANAELSLNTNEPTRVRVLYGGACDDLPGVAEDLVLSTAHQFTVVAPGLPGQFFGVEISDAADNVVYDDAGGDCFQFVEVDCNGNGNSDFEDVSTGNSPDCNNNSQPDECDIADGESVDCQTDGIPDECQSDCNANNVPDDCDIAAGVTDCNTNGVPDTCEVVDSVREFDIILSPPTEMPRVGTVIQELDIAEHVSPSRVVVTLNLEHDNIAAVRIRLMHGDIVKLADACPIFVGENFTDTVFTDEATVPICDGEPPFTGEFLPSDPLSVFSDQDIAGLWRLLVSSTGTGGCGRVRGWKLSFETPASDCNANGIPDDCDLESGALTDADGDGIPDECAVCSNIVASIPAHDAIDARQPHAIDDATDKLGWDVVTLDFDGPTTGLAVDAFEVTQQGGSGPVPTVVEVVNSGPNSLDVHLSASIESGAWTTLTHTCSGSVVRLGALPGDVTGDGVTKPSDIMALVDKLNGVSDVPSYRSDINRSGQTEPQDILRLIDLLNGAGAFEVWNGRTLP